MSLGPRGILRYAETNLHDFALVFMARSFVLAVLPSARRVRARRGSGVQQLSACRSRGHLSSGPVLRRREQLPRALEHRAVVEVSLDIVHPGFGSVRLTGWRRSSSERETGTSQFDGSVDENHVSALLIGENSNTKGECKYTFDGDFSAALNGQVLTGRSSILPKPTVAPTAPG